MIINHNYYIKEGNVLKKILYIPLDYNGENLIPKGITDIASDCFAGVDGISNLILPSSIINIQPRAFQGARGLKKVYIPSSVKKVGSEAFLNCKDLEEVHYFPGIVWGAFVFRGCRKLQKLYNNNHEARVFYLPRNQNQALTVLHPTLSTNEYQVYVGVFPRMGALTTTQIQFDGTNESLLLYFVVINDILGEYVWFDTDLDTAILGARYKASRLSHYAFFHKEYKKDFSDWIDRTEFKMLIGTCYDGAEVCFRMCGSTNEKDKIQLGTILVKAKEIAPVLYERILYAISHQYDHTNLLDPENFLIWKDVNINFEKWREPIQTEGQGVQGKN